MGAYRNVHTEHLDDTPRHPVRESLYYALVLLELADRSLQGRAEAVIRRVIALQETGDPQAKTHGLWPYFLEDPVSSWPWPDFNWADFNGMTLLLIRQRHGRRLPAPLVGEIERAIMRAAICIRRRNVNLNYTNIAIKGTFVALSAAEMSGDGELLGYALDRLRRLRDAVMAAGGFAEYNSPTYAAVSLAGLHAIATYAEDSRARALVAPLIKRFWRDIAERLHPETRELAGPHARAYTIRLGEAPELLGSLIEKASRGAVVYPQVQGREAFGALYACVLSVNVPAEIVAALSAPASRPCETVVCSQANPSEAPRVQTTWLEPAFCLGSVSFQDGWEQRHNLIAYWKSHDGKVASLAHRYLRDDRPCCSGYFVSEQREGAVAAGAFLGAYADHHVSVPADGATCSFLGAVVEIDAAGEGCDVRLDGKTVGAGRTEGVAEGAVVTVGLSAVVIEWSPTLHETLPGNAPCARVEHVSKGRVRLVLPHYEGVMRKVKWREFGRAVSAYTLRMAPAGTALPSLDGLSVALPETTPESQRAAEEWGMRQALVRV